ncbi:uncharacterized protein L969DRAFT_15197 [Mixia osmundae IAM 14324]|uniref:Uncharacterized protein n=1 Tax=Mixia osmundae (strain CBS 9802 / IAM 14324 / JCM 22182 / KY 12970) TaxID=764103 RepID=G7DXM4_MIXOS|nr:uncharacterized protein L969DRAFT_15197 [Mixia osmundae IAM 14324]KEI41172.1 hypothetical protein L969DRAFT_15197 [Mixia osmundae IAM 14324]GAA95334.1 hypothetical protein E5Q_01991 [Mixia osmundae IAM 14324]
MSGEAQTGSGQAGQDIGKGVKGLFNTIHGAGETIRGTINSTLDGLGDGVAQRESGSAASRTEAQSGDSTVQKGQAEFKQGLSDMTGGSK